MDKIKILIVDDHDIVRKAIKLMLETCDEFEIVSEAKNGKDSIAYLKKNSAKIDVVVMDISMPDMNGVETTKIIMEENNNQKILGVSMHAKNSYITDMIKAGALGYVLKEETSEMIAGIKEVALGQKYYSKQVAVIMIDSLIKDEKKNHIKLSDREKEVLLFIAEGETSTKVGKILSISSRTVETHRKNIIMKLNVRNTAEMVKYALYNNLIA